MLARLSEYQILSERVASLSIHWPPRRSMDHSSRKYDPRVPPTARVAIDKKNLPAEPSINFRVFELDLGSLRHPDDARWLALAPGTKSAGLDCRSVETLAHLERSARTSPDT